MHWIGSPLLQSIVFVRRTLARRKKPSQNGLIAKPLTSPTPCLAVERGHAALPRAASLALRRAVSRFAFFAVWAVDVHPHGVVDICAERALVSARSAVQIQVSPQPIALACRWQVVLLDPLSVLVSVLRNHATRIKWCVYRTNRMATERMPEPKLSDETCS
jgi:hypothetical protein